MIFAFLFQKVLFVGLKQSQRSTLDPTVRFPCAALQDHGGTTLGAWEGRARLRGTTRMVCFMSRFEVLKHANVWCFNMFYVWHVLTNFGSLMTYCIFLLVVYLFCIATHETSWMHEAFWNMIFRLSLSCQYLFELEDSDVLELVLTSA